MKMKKKLFIPLIAALLTIGLTSVGFAAWVITSETNKPAKGGFTVYQVDDKSVSLGNTPSAEAPVFGPSDGYDNTGKWLQFDAKSGEKTEDLECNLTFTITNWDDVKDGTITIKLSAVTTAATTGDYVTLPTARTLTINETTMKEGSTEVGKVTVSGTVATVTIPMQFGWGTYFGSENPFDYYEDKDANGDIGDTTWKEHAKAGLQAVYALNDAEFSITITASVAY